MVFLDYLIKEGELQDKYKNYYKSVKDVREDADYRYAYSRKRAEELHDYAKEYNSKLEELL